MGPHRHLKQYSGSASTSSMSAMRSMALMRDCTKAARLALKRNLSTNACAMTSALDDLLPLLTHHSSMSHMASDLWRWCGRRATP